MGAAGLAGILVFGATACGSDDGDDTADPTTTLAAPASTTVAETTTAVTYAGKTSSDEQFPEGLHGVRYCEVLLLHNDAGEFVADVWNTIGENECPQADWDALDPAAIAKEHQALVALKNGPRYWMLDTIMSDIRADAETTTFGALGMFKAATVRLGRELPNQSPYVGRDVVRDTVFRFRAGSEIHELTDPDGRVYVMQSYSVQIEPTLTIDRLADLGSVLTLPAGWTFSSRTLTADLDVLSTDGLATVVQDDLQNTYQAADTVVGA